MARAGGISIGGLNPFGGGSTSFGSFNITDSGRAAYYDFRKAEIAWEAGQLSDSAYLAALKKYADAQTPGSTSAADAQARYTDTAYTLKRNAAVTAAQNGTGSWEDVLAIVRDRLATMTETNSKAYQAALDDVHNVQQSIFGEQEKAEGELYTSGKLTTQQFLDWYLRQADDASFAGNHDLITHIHDQVDTLSTRVQSEKDQRVMDDFSDGKMGLSDFLTYATAARARYATGTASADAWDKAISQAQAQAAEQPLSYRYRLSQQYQQLQQFIETNGSAPAGGTSTRVVLGADGQWHQVSASTAPSPSELEAWQKRQIQVADAKAQLEELGRQITAAGGWVSTQQMIDFYSGQQAQYVRGSGDWYTVQSKIDSLHEQLHAESVLSQQGVVIGFSTGAASSSGGGGGGSGTTAHTTAAMTVDDFMRGIAAVESGGSYTARNASGAYGKYQIMPANWPGWAAKYLGSANAPQTPENQEKVVRGKMLDLYNWLGSWEAVAYWWNHGGTKAQATNPANWGSDSYVGNVFRNLGMAAATGPSTGAGGGWSAPGGLKGTAPSAGAPAAPGQLQAITGGAILRTGATTPSYSTTGANLPAGMDSAAFSNFYDGFRQAFRSGKNEWVDPATGIAYYIPADPDARAAMMQELDAKRIELYGYQAAAYAGTTAEISAHDKYGAAVHDAADNLFYVLDTKTKAGTIVPPSSFAANPQANGLAEGLRVFEAAKAYAKDQYSQAEADFKAGRLDQAYAHLQLADQWTSRVEQQLQSIYLPFVQGQVQSILSTYAGAEMPSEVKTDYDKLVNWQDDSSWQSILSSGDKTAGAIRAVVAVDSNGNVIYDKNPSNPALPGSLRLKSGYDAYLSDNGGVDFKPTASGTPGFDGSFRGGAPGQVRVTVNSGGDTIVAWKSYTTGIVGYSPKGDPIMGKVVEGIDPSGNHYVIAENPFEPGRWTDVTDGKPVIYSVPASFEVLPGAAAGSSTYQFRGADGYLYGLQWDSQIGEYHLLQLSGVTGQAKDVGPLSQADARAIASGAGFAPDWSTRVGSLFNNTSGAFVGFTPTDIRAMGDTYRKSLIAQGYSAPLLIFPLGNVSKAQSTILNAFADLLTGNPSPSQTGVLGIGPFRISVQGHAPVYQPPLTLQQRLALADRETAIKLKPMPIASTAAAQPAVIVPKPMPIASTAAAQPAVPAPAPPPSIKPTPMPIPSTAAAQPAPIKPVPMPIASTAAAQPPAPAPPPSIKPKPISRDRIRAV